MSDQQLDLFAGSPAPAPYHPSAQPSPPAVVPAALDDVGLLTAIPGATMAQGPALAAEAGRRRLASAIPVLEDYCRRFAGFGARRALPEQIAALDALAAIGGVAAADAVARIIARDWVQGPTLPAAVAAAARLGARLPPESVLALLRHADPGVRADACRLARPRPEIIATLIDLLDDLHGEVSMAAACALGRMGRPEAMPPLKQALRTAPSLPVIAAMPPIADEECIVLLGRIARTLPEFAAAALDAIEATEHPTAARVLQRLQKE